MVSILFDRQSAEPPALLRRERISSRLFKNVIELTFDGHALQRVDDHGAEQTFAPKSFPNR